MASPQMVAFIQSMARRWMTSTCTIEREAESFGAFGEPIHTWEILSSGTACRLITSKGANSPQLAVVADRETMEDTYRISLPVGTTLATDYRITTGGNVYNVVAVLDGRTDSADVQALLVRMRA